MQKQDILNFLKEHKTFFKKKFKVKKISLFGSYTRNEATKDSDIDLYIEFEKISYDNIYDIKIFLENYFHKKVDIVVNNNYSDSKTLNVIKQEMIHV